MLRTSLLTSKKKFWNLLNTKSPVAVNTKVKIKWTHSMPDLAGIVEAVVYTKFWLKRSGSVICSESKIPYTMEIILTYYKSTCK